jgi:hypothetical protein
LVAKQHIARQPVTVRQTQQIFDIDTVSVIQLVAKQHIARQPVTVRQTQQIFDTLKIKTAT